MAGLHDQKIEETLALNRPRLLSKQPESCERAGKAPGSPLNLIKRSLLFLRTAMYHATDCISRGKQKRGRERERKREKKIKEIENGNGGSWL